MTKRAIVRSNGWVIAGLALPAFLGLRACAAPAQLVITEVMTSAFTNCNTALQNPDFFEATNFGTNDLAWCPTRGAPN